MNFNETMVLGRLTREPMTKEINGSKVAFFTVASNRSVAKKDGSRTEKTLFLDCELWGEASSIVADRATKGTTIFVRGPLEQDTYEDKEGVKRTKFRLRVEFFQLGDAPRPRNGDEAPSRARSNEEEELPF